MSMRIIKPSSTPEKQTRTTVDTIELTQKLVGSWKLPPFQRDLKINQKVLAVAQEITSANGVLPGIITIGILDGDTYVVDGQHRIAAWQQTGLPTGYADVRMHWFETIGEMASEFVKLNSSLVVMRPDDILRGLESTSVALQKIRRKCGFIGYDMVRRSERAPVLSMSVFLRSWAGSRSEVPSHVRAQDALKTMDDAETSAAIDFATLCYEAWHRDEEYQRLWSALTLQLTMWLYRRIVLSERVSAQSRITKYSKEDFRKALTALSADSSYLEYIVGRNLKERDRAPAYNRIKRVFQRRYLAENGKKVLLPQPSWSHA